MMNCKEVFGKRYSDLNKEERAEYSRIYRIKNYETLRKKRLEKIKNSVPNIKCKECGKMYFALNTLSKFCSKECFYKDAKKSRIGKGNPAYRNGLSCNGKKKGGDRGYSKLRKETVNAMIKECGHVYCQNCGTSQSLRWEMHHIIFRSEAPRHKNIHHKNNSLFCCIQCHNNFHSKKSLRNKIVTDRELWNEFPELLYLKP